MRYGQIFRYTLDMPADGYTKNFVDPYAEEIAAAPGLVSKTWMADFDNKEFASFYLWESKQAMEAFMASPAIGRVAAEPFLKNLNISAIPVMEAPSRITRGG